MSFPVVAYLESSVPGPGVSPGIFWVLPFAALLLSIALLPLISRTSGWWEHNRNKLKLSLALAAVACGYYGLRGYGFGHGAAGWESVEQVLHHAVLGDYIPFMVLLFSLYTISGGIRLTGDIPARPLTNCMFLLAGSVLASFIGTTGASMLLIRPLLQTNMERRHVTHTVVFFIFLVSNIGGALLPVGDPPLFLGYLRGVPFLWTLHLVPIWLSTTALLLAVYFALDSYMWRKEPPRAVRLEETRVQPLKLSGKRNFALLAVVVLAVGVLVPGRELPLCRWTLPDVYLREAVMLAMAGLSWLWTPHAIHKHNHFNFHAIAEVACLFIGIFITMQIPIEILKAKGELLGLTHPAQYFWCSGMLSSFLDNAPTYVVFFELAGSMPHVAGPVLGDVATATGTIAIGHLAAISAGAVFMGANTYIGNGPNFLVKSIAEHRGVKMPSFFGYMAYSGAILIPVFLLMTVIFYW